jgi:hypothetical protein
VLFISTWGLAHTHSQQKRDFKSFITKVINKIISLDLLTFSFCIALKQVVFSKGKLVAIHEDNKFQKIFLYKLEDIKIDVIYDKTNNKLLDIVAWENSIDRVQFLKMPALDNYSGHAAGQVPI